MTHNLCSGNVNHENTCESGILYTCFVEDNCRPIYIYVVYAYMYVLLTLFVHTINKTKYEFNNNRSNITLHFSPNGLCLALMLYEYISNDLDPVVVLFIHFSKQYS